jgi:hypothetical protein
MGNEFIPAYDLESLNEQQRQDYIKAVCRHMGVPDDLNLVALTRIDDGEGPARLVAYAKRGATENVRNNLQINITSLTSEMRGGSIVFTATAVSQKTMRQEMSTGAKFIEGLTGTPLDDALMTAQTRALRRVTLQFVGAGVLDESEVHQGRTVKIVGGAAQTVSLAAPQPSVAVSTAPGKDISVLRPGYTVSPLPSIIAVDIIAEQAAAQALVNEKLDKIMKNDPTPQEAFEAFQAKLRADAIASLNVTSTSIPVSQNPPIEGVSLQPVAEKKARKPRGPNKPKVNLGPSEPPPTAAPGYNVIPTEIIEAGKSLARGIIKSLQEDAKTVVPVPVSTVPVSGSTVPVSGSGRPRLSQELVKPFRQRLFKIVNDNLEPNGFAPKEGMGNADKMRNLASIMFPDVTNLAELTVEQWEKYLGTLENKIATEGAAATVAYIEDAIGL